MGMESSLLFWVQIISIGVAFVLSAQPFIAHGTGKGKGGKKRPWTRGDIWLLGATAFLCILQISALILGNRLSDRASQAVLDNIQDVQKAVVRTASPIERVSFEMSFELPTNPLLDEWQKRVGEGISNGINEIIAGGLKPVVPNGPCARIPSAHYIVASKYGATVRLQSCNPLFPTRDEPTVRDALWLGAVELAFYKTPIDPAAFQLSRLSTFYTGTFPERLEPDLGIDQKFGQNPPTSLLINWRPPGNSAASRYQLELPKWGPAKSEWHKNSQEIEYESDLLGAQMFINFGGFGRRKPEFYSLRNALSVTHIVLRINEKNIPIDPRSLIKHVNNNGYVFWEFKFASDPDSLFRSSR